MKITSISTLFLAALSAASPHFGMASLDRWKPAGHGDFRGPCPMLNTLANHGFLPHDGRNLTREAIINGLSEGLNFNATLSSLMFDMAVVANPEPNATYFTLDNLNRHNVLEHDASLSRSDAYHGNNHIFNSTIFNKTKSYWTKPVLDVTMLANSKLVRQIQSRASNPTYTFTSSMEEFSLGEVAAPIIAFGDIQRGLVNRSLLEYFFENERLPAELGWSRPENVISLRDISKVTEMVRNATNLITPSKSRSSSVTTSRDLHGGMNV
ncbi:Peroxidase, family 2 [Aspergillus sclerotialis]|uniref:Peroxidase, family 2 n=1 Tax=Aspergillus sclerotialis TaxID=2070753 RepID=A0A3A2Z9V3_9EURO|nr:Peroxidase, family 2 [Aspergillus sclerotialis]